MNCSGLRENDWEKLEKSAAFARSPGLYRLLRYLAATSQSDPDGLKETVIGTVFFGRDATYDPRYDSIVRVSISRLRKRLDAYYETEGSDEPLRVELPRGSFEPTLKTSAIKPAEGPASVPDTLSAQQIPEQASIAPARPLAPARPGRRFPRLWLSLALPVLCVAALILGLLLRIPSPPIAVTRNLSSWPLTPGRDVETDATLSPDGHTLAYVTRRPGRLHFQIFLRPFHAIDQMGSPLDTGSGDALRPAWSPDGKTLAFLHCGIGPCDIETISAAGGTPRSVRVLSRAVLRDDQPYYWTRQQRPLWTADGRALLFPDRDQNDDREALVQYDLADRTEHTLTMGKKSDEEGAAALSPDGKTVAFVRVNLGSASIMTLDLGTMRQRVIAAGWEVHSNGMAWSPDGRGVLLSRQHGTRWEPWWVPLEGKARALSVNLPVVLNPAFEPGGSNLMATSVNRIQNIVAASEEAPGGTPQMLFRTVQRDVGGKFSPDGTRIAFLSDRSGRNEIWVAQVLAAGSAKLAEQPAQLTHNLPDSATQTFSWAPDGRALLVGMHGNPGTMATVDASTGNWKLLKIKGLEKSLLYCPIWSGDGKWIYASAYGEHSGVFRIAPDGHVPPEYLVDGQTYGIQLDGDRSLYFDSWREDGISRISLAGLGGGAKPKVEAIAELVGVLASRKWVIEGDGLYYLDFHDEERKLRRFDLRTHALRAVTGTLPNIAFAGPTLSVLPSRHLFLYSQWDENTGSQIVELRPN